MTPPPLPATPRADAPRQDVRGAYTDLAVMVRESGLLGRRHVFYWTNIVAMISAFCLIWWGVVLVGDSWFQLLLAAALGIVVTQFGFLGHDGAHQQMFRSPAWNEWTSRLLAGIFAGLAFGWWRSKHNRHHTSPNQEGRDPDIFPGSISFTPAAVAARTSRFGRWFVKRQGWLFFPLLSLEGLNLHAESVRALVTPGSFPHRKLELVLVGGRLSTYVAALVVLLPPTKAAAFFAVQMGVFGLCLGGSFAPSHKGMPIVPPDAKIDFFRRQVLMSRNVRGGLLLEFAMGGLNYQIEHHLFPNMARPNLKHLRAIVRDYCALQGVPYTEVGLLESYGIVISYLNHVGIQARGPFECPITAQYRT
jgi:fatty acid desaturase